MMRPTVSNCGNKHCHSYEWILVMVSSSFLYTVLFVASSGFFTPEFCYQNSAGASKGHPAGLQNLLYVFLSWSISSLQTLAALVLLDSQLEPHSRECGSIWVSFPSLCPGPGSQPCWSNCWTCLFSIFKFIVFHLFSCIFFFFRIKVIFLKAYFYMVVTFAIWIKRPRLVFINWSWLEAEVMWHLLRPCLLRKVW